MHRALKDIAAKVLARILDIIQMNIFLPDDLSINFELIINEYWEFFSN